MAHKIAVKISKSNKNNYIKAYARTVDNVANTVNVVSTKFAWTFINIEFLQCIFKSRKRLNFHSTLQCSSFFLFCYQIWDLVSLVLI